MLNVEITSSNAFSSSCHVFCTHGDCSIRVFKTRMWFLLCNFMAKILLDFTTNTHSNFQADSVNSEPCRFI